MLKFVFVFSSPLTVFYNTFVFYSAFFFKKIIKILIEASLYFSLVFVFTVYLRKH